MRPVGWRAGIREHLPLGSLDIGFRDVGLDVPTANRFDGRPDSRGRMLVDSRQRPGLSQCFHHDGDFRFRIDLLEVIPTVTDELRGRITGDRDSQCRKRDWEPTVGRTQQYGSRPFLAVGVVAIQMWMTSTAPRQVLLGGLAEGVGHVAGRTAFVTLDPKVFRLKRRATFEESQRTPAPGRSAVHEVVPWEIVQVAISASEQETRRNGVRVLGAKVTLRSLTSLVDEPGVLRPKPVFLDLEQTEIDFGQQAAFHTTEPTWKWPHRHAESAPRRSTGRDTRFAGTAACAGSRPDDRARSAPPTAAELLQSVYSVPFPNGPHPS